MTSAATLPCALDAIEELLRRRNEIVFSLDYDGTLTPIVSRPEEAVLSTGMREAVRALARQYPVFVVSGRGRRNVEEMVGLDGLGYVGSHGFDVVGPSGSEIRRETAASALPSLDRAESELREALAEIPGSLVERKRFGVAVHFRLAADGAFGLIDEAIRTAIAQHSDLRRAEGKKVIELRPDVDWDKGHAVTWLLEELGLRDAYPIHIGDDLTDETVFNVLVDRGLGIFVGSDDRPTAATLRLENPDEVRTFLERMTIDATAMS